MLKKLRIKLIAVSAVSLLIVLVVIIGSVNVANYIRIVRDADEILNVLAENGGTFRSFLVTSCVMSFLGLAAVLLLLILLSGRIIKPVSESYEKQKRFITDAGHEIKTPLTIIDADADILEMEFGENEWIRDIQNQTSRLAALTGDLIRLSRMEESSDQFRMIRFPLSDVAEETAQSFQALARTQNKTFRVSIQPMISVCGDEQALRRLISILLDNALKYSNEGGMITLKLEKQGRTVKLSVANTAEHIEPEKLPYLFERFYRMDPSRNSGTGGYGIGLSIARAVVTAHKGKINASSPDGQSLMGRSFRQRSRSGPSLQISGQRWSTG